MKYSEGEKQRAQQEQQRQNRLNLSVPGNETFSLVDNGGLSLAEGSYPLGFFDRGAEAPSGSIFAGGGYEVADSGQIAADVRPDAPNAQNDQSPGLTINVYWDDAPSGTGTGPSVGPISGSGLSGFIDGFKQGLGGDFSGIRAALNSGDPLIDPQSIWNAGKSVLSFLGDSAIEMIPGSGAFEFGQAARARNDALGQSLRSGISNAVNGLFDNFSLAYDSYRAGDTFGAGSILGDMAYGSARDVGIALVTGGVSRAGLLSDTSFGLRSPSALARDFQGIDPYFGVDRYRDITIKKGTFIVAGTHSADFDALSGYFTTVSGLNRTMVDGFVDAQAFNQGLQVSGAGRSLFRPGATVYEVTQDVPGAFGIASKNPALNPTGYRPLPQLFVPNYGDQNYYQSVLRPVVSIPAVNREVPPYPGLSVLRSNGGQ